ncbi:hypothetical protein [Azospirillum sp. SYSU D00513]|nr:hypothetical protein [Azospirillum sp. SYSU D00513]
MEDRNGMNPEGQKDKPGQDQGGEKTLTEKEEDEAGGRNKNTPGPVYDV